MGRQSTVNHRPDQSLPYFPRPCAPLAIMPLVTLPRFARLAFRVHCLLLHCSIGSCRTRQVLGIYDTLRSRIEWFAAHPFPRSRSQASRRPDSCLFRTHEAAWRRWRRTQCRQPMEETVGRIPSGRLCVLELRAAGIGLAEYLPRANWAGSPPGRACRKRSLDRVRAE